MAKQQAPLQHLQNYLPPGVYDAVAGYLHQYKVHLTIAKERKTVLGDYRHRTDHANHRISVNGNLNVYAFLVTLLHELAHLLTFEQYTGRVAAHGKEWKETYSRLLDQFLKNKVFPPDIEKELLRSIRNPAASSCAEEGLLRVLRKYDAGENPHRLLEELSPGSVFRISDGRIFQKGIKLRKRFQCKEIKTGRTYLFSPVYEVEET